MKPFFFLLSLLMTLLVVSCQKDTSEMPGTPPSNKLLSVAQAQLLLEANSNEPIIIEVSKPEHYQEGHLEGAFQVWRPDYENKTDYPFGGMRPKRGDVANLLRKFGVQPSSPILLYDCKGSVDALRFAWLLEMYGHPEVFVMDGGKTAWKSAGFALSKVPSPLPEPSNYQFPSPVNLETLATFEEVLIALEDTNTILLDTREPEEFSGAPYLDKDTVLLWKTGAYTNGHIPGAIHLNWSKAVDLKDDHCFKSIEDLAYNAQKVGLKKDKQIIVYCQSGVRSAHTSFVLRELLGFFYVKNYDGSWIEWSYQHNLNPAIPIEKEITAKEQKQQIALLEKSLLETTLSE